MIVRFGKRHPDISFTVPSHPVLPKCSQKLSVDVDTPARKNLYPERQCQCMALSSSGGSASNGLL
jgi:hypothetical protein